MCLNYTFNLAKSSTTDLHQPLQLEKLAVKILKVVLVKSPQAVVIHDFHQHTEGLFLRHLESHGNLLTSSNINMLHTRRAKCKEN